MLKTFVLIGLTALAVVLAPPLAVPARAQLGNIFRDDPPRPPRGMQQDDEEEEEVPELPQGRLLPAPNRVPPGQGAPPPGAYQSQPLPPPPGAAVNPQTTRAPPISITPPSAAPPPAVANAPSAPAPGASKPVIAPPAPASLQPGDEVVSAPPPQKIANKKATFSGLDKITGRIISFDADIGETVQFGALRVKPDACYTRPATEAANTDAFVEVDEITLQGEVKRIFSGWMFAASPGLHGVEHPIYDVWLTDCKAPDLPVVAAKPEPKPEPKPVATPAPQRRAGPRPAPRQTPRPAPPGPQEQQNGIFPPFGR